MKLKFWAALAALMPLAATAQEAVGTLTIDAEGERREFVVIQGAEGPNPGSRYSRIGGDLVLTVVAVAGQEPIPPEDAAETVELRFTASESDAEVRTGSILSYSTRDEEGLSSTRGGTTDVALDELAAENDSVVASGSFTTELPPDEQSAGSEIEGTFRTTMKSREATQQ